MTFFYFVRTADKGCILYVYEMDSNKNLFVHFENQTILWNIIQISPLWPAFTETAIDKDIWFRNIIKNMYEFHYSFSNDLLNHDPKEKLKMVNRETVQYMKKSIKEILSLSSPSSTPTNSSSNDITSTYNRVNALAESYDVAKEKQRVSDESTKKYEEFKDKYTAGFNKPVPPQLNITQSSIDEKITSDSMDQLIKEQLLSREKDLEKYHTNMNSSATAAL